MPKKMENGRKYSLWLPEETIGLLGLIQKRTMAPASAIIRRALDEYLEREPDIDDMRRQEKEERPYRRAINNDEPIEMQAETLRLKAAKAGNGGETR
jgi:hypothetical protein